jgi:alpha-galactosidase
MLEVGNGMTENEDRAHFSMWCMLAAPLISGNDLRNMPKQTLKILTNKDAIVVDQDSLGVEGFQYSSDGVLEVWFKPLVDGDRAMCMLNRSTRPQKVRFDWKKEKVSDDFSKKETRFDTTAYRVRDLWTKKDLGTTEETLNAELPGHDVLMLQLQKQ